MIRQTLEDAGSYALYVVILLAINFFGAASAATVESDFKDAQSIFARRDLASGERALHMLEKILDQKADHLETQALISYIYAHEAFILTQLGEKATEFQNSADAFAKAVLTQQPQNANAKKASWLLMLIAGNHIDVKKILEKEITDKEVDADLWYMFATVNEGEKMQASLAKALSLNPEHIWIYSDLAFRAIKLGDLATAERWLSVLEARRSGSADGDLIRAALAAQKQDKKSAEAAWKSFSAKVPEFPLVKKISGKAVRKPASKRKVG